MFGRASTSCAARISSSFRKTKATAKAKKMTMMTTKPTTAICAEAGDNGSCGLFQRMLKDEEGHADFLDAQLHSIKEMGIANYLAQQLHGEK
jgi:bacterioferritin